MDEKVFEQTRNFWGDTVRRGNLLYPNDKVIRFMKRNFKNPSKTTVLDFGCGGGRNSLALACEGYRVIAMDYTDTAIEMTTAKLHGMGNVSIMQNKGLDIPLEDSSVDAIVADGSLFYNNLTNTAKLLGNLKKTLKPGGLMWADFRSTEDSLYGGGYQLTISILCLMTEPTAAALHTFLLTRKF